LPSRREQKQESVFACRGDMPMRTEEAKSEARGRMRTAPEKNRQASAETWWRARKAARLEQNNRFYGGEDALLNASSRHLSTRRNRRIDVVYITSTGAGVCTRTMPQQSAFSIGAAPRREHEK